MSDYYSERVDYGPLFSTPAPSVRGSITSAAAAEAMDAKTLNRLERVVMQWLAANGPATDEEITAGTGLNPSTARPRRVALVGHGLVVEAGEKKTRSGRKATAWKVAQLTAASR